MKQKLLLFFCLFVVQKAIAQKIAGRITDMKNEAVIGAVIQVEGTNYGSASDADGYFKILNLKPGKYKLRVSYIGYRSEVREIDLQEADVIVNVTLKEDPKNLDDVVIVGYGTQRRREISGSIVKLDGKQITDMPAPSFEAALQGKASGVQVSVGSGLAGSSSIIRIRGIASISAGGDPLYVVDGIPITQNQFLVGNSGGMNNNPLASINPQDIESIQILKDASATGIYGSRGSNGVILITTKRGAKKGFRVDFTTRVGISQPTAKPNMLNSKQYLQIYQEAYENDGGTGRAKLPGNMSWELAEKTNTNWVDETVGTGFKQMYSVGLSKGAEKYNTYFNITYDDNGSYLIGNSYDRLSTRFNADVKLTKNLNASLSSSLSRGINNRVDAAWSGGLGAAMSTTLPIYPVRNADGTYFNNGVNNPVRTRDLRKWRTQETRTINNITLDYRPFKGLSVRGSGSYDYMDLTEDIYEPREYINSTHAGNAYRNPTWVSNYNYNITAQYDYDYLLKSRFSLMLGNEYQHSLTKGQNISYTNANGPVYKGINDDAVKAAPKNTASQEWAFISYFGRLNYNYAGKLFVTLTGRVDGSSRFGINNRYGFFPSASIGYVVSQENFIKRIPQISFLKVRAGYGKTGNADLPNYQWRGTFVPASVAGNYNGQPFSNPSRLENPDLKWETSLTIDAALELGLLKDRITMEFGVYQKLSSDVILNLTVPPSFGFSNYWDNVGSIRNRGIEFSLHTINIDKAKFKWTSDFNVARNFNEITNIGAYSSDAVSGGTNDTRVVVGSPVGTNFLVRFSHVDKQNGLPVYLDINGKETYTWDPVNRVSVGSVLPKAVGGFTNTFNYKNIDLSFLMVFSYGGNIYNSSSKRQIGVVTDWNMTTDIFDRWQKPGDDAKYPRLTQNTLTYGSTTPWINTTMYLHDASYARLRNVTLSYNFDKKLISRAKIQTARLSFIATNIFVITKYPGLDSEIARDFENATDRNMSPNITYLTPPQEKTYSIQLTVGF
ncbi:MAG: TonB-dependent receptor [Bacteroidota bacterium]|nr:TonB-dependent receptor [Bacteroidota bacterium]